MTLAICPWLKKQWIGCWKVMTYGWGQISEVNQLVFISNFVPCHSVWWHPCLNHQRQPGITQLGFAVTESKRETAHFGVCRCHILTLSVIHSRLNMSNQPRVATWWGNTRVISVKDEYWWKNTHPHTHSHTLQLLLILSTDKLSQWKGGCQLPRRYDGIFRQIDVHSCLYLCFILQGFYSQRHVFSWRWFIVNNF